MKKEFTTPKMEKQMFAFEDVITTSGAGNNFVGAMAANTNIDANNIATKSIGDFTVTF